MTWRVIRGSALGALNGEAQWEAKIDELMEAVDKQVLMPKRAIDQPFLMPDRKTSSRSRGAGRCHGKDRAQAR